MNLICIEVEGNYFVGILKRNPQQRREPKIRRIFMYNISIVVNKYRAGLEAEIMETSNHS